MRILLIQSWLGRREPPVAPLGLLTLAAQLRQHLVKVFDPNVAQNPLPDTFGVIQSFNPEVIGISLRNVDTTKYNDQFFYFEHFCDLVKAIKQGTPKATLVVGGGGFSLFPHEIMARVPQIDFGFFLEADASFPQFLEPGTKTEDVPGIYYRKNDQITLTALPTRPDLNTIAPPQWELINLKDYARFAERAAIGVEAKRGCALQCAYCTYPQLSGSPVRTKPAAKVVDELDRLQSQFGIEQVFFTDPVFNYPREHAEAICREILQRHLKIRWGGYHQDHFLTAEYITLARAAGCADFYFSPDSATEQGLKVLNKATTVASLHRSLDLIKQDGKAKASYSFFAAVPGTGWANFIAALLFLWKARLKLGHRLTRAKLGYIRLEPKTILSSEKNTASKYVSLLPAQSKDLRNLFYRQSTSLSLNLLLKLHFNLGIKLAKRNVLREL